MSEKLLELKRRKGLSLEEKIELTNKSIRNFYDYMDGKVYISFSGGKDSTVLLNLVRDIYPDVPAVFSDTGLEYPEIRDFVRTIGNVIWIKPKHSFYEVIQKYGYPVISKEQSLYIEQYRKTKSDYLKNVRWNGKGINKIGKISNKWKFLVNAPFKISNRCCDILKKDPLHRYEKESKRKPFIGTMTSDSRIRERLYLRNGCTIFEDKKEKCMPLSWWVESDVWSYIKNNNVKYCDIYNKGIDRTGCIYCMFGCQHEENNRFEILKILHPELHEYCMKNLGMREVLNYIRNKGVVNEETQNSNA